MARPPDSRMGNSGCWSCRTALPEALRDRIGALVVGTVGGGALNLKPVTAIVPGLAILYIASELRRYLAAVDEFTRKLLLESVLWAYLFAGVAMMFAMGIIQAYDLSVHPLLLIWGLGCVEGLRGTFLYFLARRHR